jgi:choline dehydrogenase-like flavoprotein
MADRAPHGERRAGSPPAGASIPDRASLALAEAILPGSAEIPAADEQTVEAVEAVVRELHPQLVHAWRFAHRALDAAAIARTGRRFHRNSAAVQDALLNRWERDVVLGRPLGFLALVYKMVHFDRVATRAMATSLDVIRTLEQPRWLAQVQSADGWSEGDIECDAVVVGSGAGGAVVGRELVDRGHAVVFLEEGEFHRRDAFDGSSVRAHQRFYRAAFSVGNVMMPIFVGRLVGGSTAINGGTCFRPPSWVHDRWCEDLATDELGAAAMNRHFERVENVLDVQTARRETIGPIGDVMARGCDALGWSHFAVRRNAPDCDGSGFCDFGCRREARRGTQIAYLPPALDRGALLLTGAKAERVILENGRAVGIEAVSKTGRRVVVRARAVVLAGGSIPTPLLMMKQGLGSTSGQLGRNLTLHPSCGFSALFDQKIEGHSHIPQGYTCDHFLREGMLITAAQPARNIAPLVFPFTGHRLMETLRQVDNVASFGLMIRDSKPNGRVVRDALGFPLITYNVSPEDVGRMHEAMIHTAELCIAAGASTLYPVTPQMPVMDGARDLDAFRKLRLRPQDFVWLSYHPLGTCKMGRDPKTSVVGLDHQVHDTPGLYVVDGSTVPGPLGVNPQLTIMAMATRAGEILSERL